MTAWATKLPDHDMGAARSYMNVRDSSQVAWAEFHIASWGSRPVLYQTGKWLSSHDMVLLLLSSLTVLRSGATPGTWYSYDLNLIFEGNIR